MRISRQKAIETAAFIRGRIPEPPRIGLITGTGLGQSAEAFQTAISLDYREIPHFPVSTVPSHHGRLFCGALAGKPVMALQGRFHLYEGYSPQEVVFPVRVMQELGVKVLIVANASGGLNLGFREGDIMLIEDHINLTGENPLLGPNEEDWGDRFPDMIRAYSPELARLAAKAAADAGLPLQKGVYAGLKGPSLETPAETRYLKTIGADAVGFSTVQEVIAAVHARMKVLGLATITNINDPDHPRPATVEAIIAIAAAAAPRLDTIIHKVVEEIDHAWLS